MVIQMMIGLSKGHGKFPWSRLLRVLPFYFFAFLLFTSCGSDGDRFRLQGRLRNMNQGEFWVYSMDGGISGIDTITVREGRFSYELELRTPTTLVIVFPNYSEQAVFAEPGAEVTIKGDASHLKEMTVKGTDDNELMTKQRMELNRLMPPDIPKAVEGFIREHPESPVSIYLLQRYFVLSPTPNYVLAKRLTDELLKVNSDNGQLLHLKKRLEVQQGGAVKSKLPKFSATDVKGKAVNQNDLKGKVNVVSLWASWSYRSTDMQRRLDRLKKKHGDKLAVVSICLDGDVKGCKQRLERDSVKWPTVCYGRLWDMPLLAKFGLGSIPGCVLADANGRIVARDLTPQKLEEEINKLVGQ
jgi:hypothetical protein